MRPRKAVKKKNRTMAEPSDPRDDGELDSLPEPVLRGRHRARPSIIWLVPVVAAIAGLLLIVRAFLQTGPSITITFDTAEGLDPGKTEVRYKDVVVGKVRSVEMSDDRTHVEVKVDLTREAASIAVEDTQFWVVRVRADLGGISGFKTLVSGTYIGVNLGKSSESRREFVGLEDPPLMTSDEKGRRFHLRTADLGSINVGSPVYFRRVPVGRVVGVELDDDGSGVDVVAFVEEPYARFVTTQTQFWNTSGLDLSFDANGFKLDTASLVTLVAGGVQFQVPPGTDPGPPAPDNARFELHPNPAAALATRDAVVMPVRMRFGESTRGLAIDGPVDFRGIVIGRIKALELAFDARTQRFHTEVSAELYPQRLGRAYEQVIADKPANGQSPEALFAHLIQRGLRAQLRAGNLITGQLYVALDFPAKSKAAEIDLAARPLQIPTEPASLDQIQTRVTDIVSKIDQVPFDEIGQRLNAALGSANALLSRLDNEVAPEATLTLREARATLDAANRSLASPEAPIQQDMHRTLLEVERTVRSLRDLSDYLQRHPESLLRGRRDGGTSAAPVVVPQRPPQEEKAQP
jgi:paraquat-inducible protein B